MIRVAVAQFQLGKDTDRMLADMLRLIDEAAAGGAAIVQLQENCNYPTWYKDRAEAWEQAITIPSPMWNAISAAAKKNNIYVGFNAAIRGEYPNAYMVNHLIGRNGEHVGSNEKQVLMWIEREAFIPSETPNSVFDTDIGRIGLMSCMDGLIPETTRTLALQGADIVLNSLCSNGIDEAHVHIPARAAENGLFMLSANRVGDMLEGEDLEGLMKAAGMTREKVAGAGESQVSGPNGVLHARASRDKTEVVFADIDLSDLPRDDLLSRRRPELYGLITTPNDQLEALYAGRPEAGTVKITTFNPPAHFCPAAVNKAVAAIEASEPGLFVLPEYFAWKLDALTPTDPVKGEIDLAIERLAAAAAKVGTYVVAGVPDIIDRKVVNRAVLIGPEGVIGQYLATHKDLSNGWEPLGDSFPVFDLPFGRLGMLLGEDLMYCEAGRMMGRQGVDIVACPANFQQQWHADLMLTERSAENRITIVAVSRVDAPVAVPARVMTTPPVYRFPETNEVSNPDRHEAEELVGTYTVEIDLAPNRDKRLMGATNVIMDTRPELYDRLVAPVA